jgi:2'-phosphotransferase
VDIATVLRLVEENAKKRFEVVWGYDPSPPIPKGKGKNKGQGQGQGQGQTKKQKEKDRLRQQQRELQAERAQRGPGQAREAEATAGTVVGGEKTEPGLENSSVRGNASSDQVTETQSSKEVDATLIDAAQAMQKVRLDAEPRSESVTEDKGPSGSLQSDKPPSTELPLVILPSHDDINDDLNISFPGENTTSSRPNTPGKTLTSKRNSGSSETVQPQPEYFIRASQGHSIQLDSVSHLTPVQDDEDGRKRVGDIVHGTKWELWDVLRESVSKSQGVVRLPPLGSGRPKSWKTEILDSEFRPLYEAVLLQDSFQTTTSALSTTHFSLLRSLQDVSTTYPPRPNS